MDIKNNYFATGIGSLPFLNAQKAVDFIFDSLKGHIPFWPQLPRVSFLENMQIQSSEGFPGLTIVQQDKNVYVNTSKVSFLDEFEACYHAINTEQIEYFKINQSCAAGFYEFISRIGREKAPFIKGQLIGPISYAATLLDENNTPLLFNAELGAIIPQFLALKAVWQIKEFKKVSSAKTIIFIDEPYLVALGTNQFAALKKEDIILKFNIIIKAIHEHGALAGMHCCGNTDWTVCLDSDIDILSFDAFEFLDSLFIYKKNMEDFVRRGGVFACGIVPNKQDYNFQNYAQRAKELLRQKKILLANGALITTSCGCGTLSEELAVKLHLLAVEIAQELRIK